MFLYCCNGIFVYEDTVCNSVIFFISDEIILQQTVRLKRTNATPIELGYNAVALVQILDCFILIL